MNKQLLIEKTIARLVGQGANFYCGHSGGKDSQAMYLMLRDLVPADQLKVVHADLGDVEHPGTRQHIEITISSPLYIAKPIFKNGSSKNFFNMIEARSATLARKKKIAAPWPDSKNRFCTSDLKTNPIWKVIRRLQGPTGIAVNCVGIRGDESDTRSQKVADRPLDQLTSNIKGTTQNRQGFDLWPIAYLTTAEVFQAIADAGEKPHPAYQAGNDRLSCMFCIFGSTNDLKNARRQNPDLYTRYVNLERSTGFTMFNGKSLEERTQ